MAMKHYYKISKVFIFVYIFKLLIQVSNNDVYVLHTTKGMILTYQQYKSDLSNAFQFRMNTWPTPTLQMYLI